ncbi:hypothetical protein ACHAW5_003158 [Stephanodiscus triporus]|uniref:Uncharacterized protein n=1 Tax=Stephanodiscus triporus TaxID=2934178 RepID=A0ABD3MTE6_9STRA
MNDHPMTPADDFDFYARALSSLTQRIALANDDGGGGASNTPNTAAAGVVVATTTSTIDDVDALESHAKSLVEDDVPKIDRAVRNYLALIAARSAVASDVDVLSASHSSMTLLAGSGDNSERSSSRSAAADVNQRSLLCARALLSAINSTVLPTLDATDGIDDDCDDETRATKKMQSSHKNAATRILWNRLVVKPSTESTSESSIINGSCNSNDEKTMRRNIKPSKVLGRRSLIVAYPYIQERLRRGHCRGEQADVDVDVDGDAIDSQTMEGPSSFSAKHGSHRAERRRAIRSLSDDALPPAIPPVGVDLDQWESFYTEFGRLLSRKDDDDRDDEGGVSSRREQHRSMDGERRHRDDDGALLWSKDGGLAELRSRREDRARRASSGASTSLEG